jgi:hypothetical protein
MIATMAWNDSLISLGTSKGNLPAGKETGTLNQNIQNMGRQFRLVVNWRSAGHQTPKSEQEKGVTVGLCRNYTKNI